MKLTTIRFNNTSWQMEKNGSQGIILIKNNPTRVMFIDCMENESVDNLYDQWKTMFGEEAE